MSFTHLATPLRESSPIWPHAASTVHFWSPPTQKIKSLPEVRMRNRAVIYLCIYTRHAPLDGALAGNGEPAYSLLSMCSEIALGNQSKWVRSNVHASIKPSVFPSSLSGGKNVLLRTCADGLASVGRLECVPLLGF